jgi:RND family efflux transporter MFP subunit
VKHLTPLLLALFLTACGTAPSDSTTDEGTPVRTGVASSGPAVASLNTNGIVAARDEMRLSFKTGGIIRRIAVQEGQAVKKGQLLAELELTEINAQFQQAKQVADKAARDLERGERLHADQVISLEALQNLRTQAAITAAARDAARFNLGQSTIVAARDGVILRQLAEERELVPPGQPIIVLGSSERGHIVRAALSDRDLVRVTVGDRADIQLDAYPGRRFTGKVHEVSAAADPRNGLFPIEVHFDAPGDIKLATGFVAKLQITPAAAATSSLTYIPIAALVEGDGDVAQVFVVDGAVARKREVKVAFIDGNNVALSSGLSSGTPLVTEGALYLVDGERINPITTAAN